MTTPTTKDIKRTYVRAKRNLSVWTDGERKAKKEFDLWLNEVRAQAWEEGMYAGKADDYFGNPDNPYRQEEHHHTRRSSFGDPYCVTCGADLEGENK